MTATSSPSRAAVIATVQLPPSETTLELDKTTAPSTIGKPSISKNSSTTLPDTTLKPITAPTIHHHVGLVSHPRHPTLIYYCDLYSWCKPPAMIQRRKLAIIVLLAGITIPVERARSIRSGCCTHLHTCVPIGGWLCQRVRPK